MGGKSPPTSPKSGDRSPKSGDSSPKSTGKKGLARQGTGKKLGEKKKPAGPIEEINFCGDVNAETPKKELARVLSLLMGAVSAGQADLVEAACGAIVRLCNDIDGFKIMLKCGVVETMQNMLGAEQKDKAIEVALYDAQVGVCRGAATWCDTVDPVDFPEIPNLLYICNWLSGGDEDVAVSALGAMDRFVMHRRENAATLLQASVLNIVHTIIGTHRAPELVQEAFALLFRLCDLPAESVLEHLSAERELVLSVVESMDHAPLNVRLQMFGLRLLCLWYKMKDKKLEKAFEEADVQGCMTRSRGHLVKAGFSHTAAWMSVMSGPLAP